jgi:hypothetical protein
VSNSFFRFCSLVLFMYSFLSFCFFPSPILRSTLSGYAYSPYCTNFFSPMLMLIRAPPADIAADAILLYVPLRIFQSLQSKRLRRKLSVIFSTCVCTTIVSSNFLQSILSFFRYQISWFMFMPCPSAAFSFIPLASLCA